jgi:hypothetical protein
VISNYLVRASKVEAAAALSLSTRLEGLARKVDAKTQAAKETRAEPHKRPRKKAPRPAGKKKAAKRRSGS